MPNEVSAVRQTPISTTVIQHKFFILIHFNILLKEYQTQFLKTNKNWNSDQKQKGKYNAHYKQA